MWKTYGWRRNKREIELNCLKGSFGKKKTVEIIEKVSLCLRSEKRENGVTEKSHLSPSKQEKSRKGNTEKSHYIINLNKKKLGQN